MASTAQTFYLGSTRETGVPASADDLVTVAEAGSTTTQTTHSTTSATTVRLKPFVTNAATGAITAATGNGWRMKATADVASTAAAQRIVPAGTWSFTLVAQSDASTTGSSTTITCVVHRVSSAGVLTELFRFASAAVSVSSLTPATITATSSAQPQFTLAAGESIQFEFWASSVGQAITGTAQTLRYSTSSASFTSLPTPGLRTQYARTYSNPAGGSTNTYSQYIVRNRSVSDAANGSTNTLARSQVLGRTTVDAANGSTNTVSRTVKTNRAITENIGPTGGSTTTVTIAPAFILVDGKPAINLGGPQYTAV